MKYDSSCKFGLAVKLAGRLRLASSKGEAHDRILWASLMEKLEESHAESLQLIEALRKENARLVEALRHISNPYWFLREKAMSDGKELPSKLYLERMGEDPEYLKYLAKKALE